MSDILVVAEHDNHGLKPGIANTLTAAMQLPGSITVLVAGFQCQSVAEKVSCLEGVAQVILADAPCYAQGLAENISALIMKILAELGKPHAYVLAPSTTYGKNILPRIAALNGVSQISDVVKIVSEDTFVRPIYAGNALTTVQSQDSLKVMTIRTTAFDPVVSRETSANIIKLDYQTDMQLSRFVSQETHVSKRPDLRSARVVIAGGRGLKNAENFKLLEVLADKLQAAIGASRAAVDAGYVSNDYQIGQTGKMVAPELYIAVGISGAIQHIAGIKDSKVIVAINQDPNASIFEVADYGLVGDLFEILPELNNALHE